MYKKKTFKIVQPPKNFVSHIHLLIRSLVRFNHSSWLKIKAKIKMGNSKRLIRNIISRVISVHLLIAYVKMCVLKHFNSLDKPMEKSKNFNVVSERKNDSAINKLYTRVASKYQHSSHCL